MLKMTDILVKDGILSCILQVEGDAEQSYPIVFDVSSDNVEDFKIKSSEVPSTKKIYERQSLVALWRYKDKQFPSTITSMWY